MASMRASAGSKAAVASNGRLSKDQILESIGRLSDWLEKNDYGGYHTCAGWNAKCLRPLTFETKFLRTVLQQGVRRFPLNVRPLLGIPKDRSTKGMGYLAKGFMRLQQATGDKSCGDRAESALQWLVENESTGYSGACWGNHFDYKSPGFYLPKGVRRFETSLIGHGFLDAYNHFERDNHLQAARACEHVSRDLGIYSEADSLCIGYIPTGENEIHNANTTLGAGLLTRTYSYTRNESYRSSAQKAIQYTADQQRPNGSWYDGEAPNVQWVDNFHTVYVLNYFKYDITATRDHLVNKTPHDMGERLPCSARLQDSTSCCSPVTPRS